MPRKGSAKEAREAASGGAAPQSQRRSDRSGRHRGRRIHLWQAGRVIDERLKGVRSRAGRGELAPPLVVAEQRRLLGGRVRRSVLHRSPVVSIMMMVAVAAAVARWAGVMGKKRIGTEGLTATAAGAEKEARPSCGGGDASTRASGEISRGHSPVSPEAMAVQTARR